MARRIKLSEQERGEAVLRVLRNETTAREIARELNISEPTFYQWRDKFLQGGFQSLAQGKQRDEHARLEKEIAKRDRIIGELTVANNVLRKTMGISR